MRLSDYIAAPRDDAAVAQRVLAVVTPALVALGAGEDPEGWLAWGDDPAIRWLFLTPTPAGLVTCSVRVNVTGRGTAGERQGHALAAGPGRRALGRVGGGRTAGGVVPGREPGPARERRRGAGDHGVRDRRLPLDRPDRSGRGVTVPGPFEAVLFDLDGVLVDSEPWWNDVRIAFARAHGRPWTVDDHHAVMGANSRGWALTMQERLDLPDVDPDEIQDAIVDGVVERYRTEPPPVITGAIEAVRRIAATVARCHRLVGAPRRHRGGGRRPGAPRRPRRDRVLGRGTARQAGAGRVPRGGLAAGRGPRSVPRRRGLRQRRQGRQGGRHVRRAGPERRASRHRPGRRSSQTPSSTRCPTSTPTVSAADARSRSRIRACGKFAGPRLPRLPPWLRRSRPSPSTGRSGSDSLGWSRPSSCGAWSACGSRVATACRPDPRST